MAADLSSEIETLALSEDKIVTYKLINQKFDVTPLEAKKALENFVTKSRNDKVQKLVFFVTYSVIGEHKETKKKHVFLVNEQDIEGVTNDYKILSKQIYSIQKNFVDDFDMIYGNDLQVSSNVARKANLSSSNVGMRDMTLQQASVPTSSSAESIASSKKSDIQQITIKTQETKLSDKPSEPTKVKQEPAATVEKETSAAKKSVSNNNIAAMFSKQAKKVAEKSAEEPQAKKAKSPEVKKKSPEVKKETKPAKQKEKSSKVLKNIKKEFDDDDVEMEIEEEIVTKKAEKKETEKKKSPMKNDLFDDEHDAEMPVAPSKTTVTSDEEDEYEDEQINKKRRRKTNSKQKKGSQQVINSDDEESEDVTEKKKASKKAKIKKPDNNKEIDQMLNKENRIEESHSQKKKLVTKTFTDADGYKVTQKVWETVDDDSADTNKTDTKSHEATHSVLKEDKQKKQAAKVVMNQPTLTNFFKRN